METKEIIIFGIMFFMLSIILVLAGVHIDYVGMGIIVLQVAILIFVKSPYFKNYLVMRENHKKYNKEVIKNENIKL